MILFLHGADTFRSREHLKKIIEKFKRDRDPQGFNIARLDCEKQSYGAILEQLLVAPFLSEKRMVVLERLLTAPLPELHDELIRRIKEQTLPETTVLVVWHDAEKPKTKAAKTLYDLLKKEQYAQEFAELPDAKLLQWIQSELRERESTIDRDAAALLAQHIGSDMWRLHTLLDQLAAYARAVHHTSITKDDAALFVEEKADDNIFTLVDAIVARRAKDVFAMIEEQYRSGKDAQYMFAMILRQFRILLELRDLLDKHPNMPQDAMAKTLDLHPFVVKKSLPLARSYTREVLEERFSELLDMDIAAKTGRANPELLLDIFVARASAQ